MSDDFRMWLNETAEYVGSEKDVTLPENTTFLNMDAFYKTVAETVRITPNVVKIEYEHIEDKTDFKIKRFIVDEKNKWFSSADGVLYSKDKKTLYMVPPCYWGKEFSVPDCVKTVYKQAFEYTGFERITLGKSVKSIGYKAFSNCRKLTEIVLADSVEHMAESVFEGCKNLKEIVIPPKVKSLNNNVFGGCGSLKKIYIPENILNIYGNPCTGAESALKSFGAAKNNAHYMSIDGNLYSKDKYEMLQYAQGKNESVFTVPDGVEKIRGYAFSDCKNLKKIIIPESVGFIDYNAFCRSMLEFIEVDENNGRYTDIDGNLYSKDKKTLVRYAAGKSETEFSVPDGVEVIERNAFSACENLKKINLPQSIRFIGDGAFKRCRRLEILNIPSGVKNDLKECFDECDSMKKLVLSYNFLNEIPDLPKECAVLDERGKNFEAFEIDNGYHEITYISDGFEYAESVLKKYKGRKKKVKIPKRTLGLCTDAFIGSFAEQIFISSNVRKIQCGIGKENETLKKIHVDEKNKFYSSADGVLYSKDKRVLYYVPRQYAGKEFVVPDSVETIETYSFSYCGFERIILGRGIKRIKEEAFCRCSRLTEIILPEGLEYIGSEAFAECALPKNFILPKSVKYIGCAAFAESEIEYVYIGENVADINAPFESCGRLEKIEVDKNNKCYISIDGNLYTKDRRRIVQYAPGKEETEFSVPNCVAEICNSAFYGCINLKKAHLSESVEFIGDFAFAWCSGLENINLPQSIRNTRLFMTFIHCKSLKSIDLPDCIEETTDVFENCTSLETVSLPKGLKVLNGFENCKSLKHLTVPEGVVETDRALAGCTRIESIDLPESMAVIHTSTFKNCVNLKSIVLPGVEFVHMTAFKNCVSLESVEMPKAVWTDNDAFAGCKNLKYIYAPKLTRLWTCFNDCKKLEKVVLHDCIELKDVKFPRGCLVLDTSGEDFIKK